MVEIYQAQVKSCFGGYTTPISFNRLVKKYRGDYRELKRAIAGHKVICLDASGEIIHVKMALNFLYSKEGEIEKVAFENGYTLEHFQNFLKIYPKGKYAEEAKTRSIELEYNACAHCAQYIEFIKKHEHDFEAIEKAKERAESVCFQEISTIKDCEQFRMNFPKGNLYDNVIALEKKMTKENLYDKIGKGGMETVANEIYDNTADKELKDRLSNWLARNIALKHRQANNEISFEEFDRETSKLRSALYTWLEQYNPPINQKG